MTAKILQLRDRMLWPLSIVAGLLLQIVLASFLWGICTSFDDMKPPVLRLISLSQTAATPQPVEPAIIPVIEPAAAEPEPAIIPEAVIEQAIVEPEPVIETKPIIPEPAKTPTEVVKPKTEPVKPRPVAKTVPKVRKPDSRPQQTTPPVIAETIPAATIAQPSQISHVPVTQKTAKAQPSAANTATVNAPAQPKDFSGYLQKVYRQLERNKKYPASACRRGISGKVAVAFSINSEGKAVGATITSRSPHELADAALKLVVSQRFERPPENWNSASRIEMQVSYSLR